MKKFVIQAVLLLVVIGIGFFLANPKGEPKTLDLPFLPQPAKFANVQINDETIRVELADTPAKRSKGLAGRTSLGENEGMLFVFARADKYPFWMKGLSFSLDFVWIKDEKVEDILTNIPPPQKGQVDSTLPIYSSAVPVDKVLELNAGTVQKINIKVGDSVKLTPL